MVLLVFILHLSQSTLKSVVPLAMLLSSIWRHDNSGWEKCWFLPCLWFERPGPPFSRADHYTLYIVQNHILSIIIHCTLYKIIYCLFIIHCTLYKIIYCLWFGRPGRPQPTAWACDTGGRELYYADFDIAPFSRADHYIWYILIQYIFCQAGRFDISHLFCAPLIMQDTKALAVCRYHWYAYLSYQIRILYQWYANISHRNTQLHWSGKSW